MSVQIHLFSDPEAVAEHAADLVIKTARDAGTRNPAWIALSGGSTPRLIYRALRSRAHDLGYLRNAARFFFSDERAVPSDNEDSNYHLAYDELFAPADIPKEHVERLIGEAVNSEEEVLRYSGLLKAADQTRIGQSQIRPLDLAILGMGSDGHTASVFPDDADAMQTSLPVIAVTTSQKISRRFSMSLDYLSHAATVLFLVTGVEKAMTLRRVLQPFPGEPELPAGMVRAGRTLWYIDQTAASELDPGDKRIITGEHS
jgi:6-phosphogluconolactonase